MMVPKRPKGKLPSGWLVAGVIVAMFAIPAAVVIGVSELIMWWVG